MRDQAADAVGVDRLERRHAEDAQLDVPAEERALHVVPGEAPGHLRQVVRAEGEELGASAISPAISAARGTSIMVPIMVCTRGAGLRLDLRRAPSPCASRVISISCTEAVSGIMTSGRGSLPACLSSAAGVRDRADLHVEQAGDDQGRAGRRAGRASGSARAGGAPRRSSSLVLLGRAVVAGQGDLDREVGEVGQELVQRRVDQPDRDRQAVHRVEDLHEVAALQRLERVQRVPGRSSSSSARIEPLDELAALAEEHVLGADQADAARRRTGGPARSPRPVSALAWTAKPAPLVGVLA